MRINGFEQMKAFYSWVFDNQEKNVRTTHISLYMFLLNQNNRNKWVEWFKCPFDLAMGGSGITNKNTYYKTLLDLQDWNLIKYQKGVNNYKAPLIKIEVLFDTSTVPQSEPQLQPQVIPLPLPLLQPQMTNNIKLLTDNIKHITINIEKVLKFLNNEINNNQQQEEEIVVADSYDEYKVQISKEPNSTWLENFYRVFKLRDKTLSLVMDDFISHKRMQPDEPPKDIKEFKRHFYNWCNKVDPIGKLNSYKKHQPKEKGSL